MATPCSACQKNGIKCVILPQDSGRYTHCVFSGFKCDAKGISASDWSALEREEARIRQEKKETLAKLLRLERQEGFLRERGLAMLRRGLKTLDELEEAEQKEKDENDRRERELAASVLPTSEGGSLDFSGVAMDPELVLSPSFWEGLGFVGGTPPVTADS